MPDTIETTESIGANEMSTCSCGEARVPETRREFLQSSALGLGGVALAWMLNQDRLLAAPHIPKGGRQHSLLPRSPESAPRANAMISLFMHGGPSHVDLYDPKPELSKRNG
ncbi:MAG: DUF1501 domain-containing protein, partial [Planctomycetaceae bacterium]